MSLSTASDGAKLEATVTSGVLHSPKTIVQLKGYTPQHLEYEEAENDDVPEQPAPSACGETAEPHVSVMGALRAVAAKPPSAAVAAADAVLAGGAAEIAALRAALQKSADEAKTLAKTVAVDKAAAAAKIAHLEKELAVAKAASSAGGSGAAALAVAAVAPAIAGASSGDEEVVKLRADLILATMEVAAYQKALKHALDVIVEEKTKD